MDFLIELDHALLFIINGMAKNFNSVDIFVDMLEENRLFRVILVSVLWFFWYYDRHDGLLRERRKAIIATVAGTMAAVLFTVLLTDLLPFRFRPVHDPDLKTKLKFVEDSKYILQGFSAFPSDTATLIGGLASGAFFFASNIVGVVAIGYALIFSLVPRVFLGLHFPSDILVGASIGFLFVALSNTTKMKELLSKDLLVFSDRHPHIFNCLFFILTYELASLFIELRDIGEIGIVIMRALFRSIV